MTDDVAAREIAREQEYVDTVYRQLAESARSAEHLAAEGRARGQLGHEGGLVERDAMLYQAARRIATLDAAHEGLVFGRLDMRSEVDPEPRYVGRIGLRDGNRDVLLIDWRAPAAAVFYQATHADPHGVVRRRILRSHGENVVGVEDDLLDAEANEAADLPIVGEGALMAQLSRASDRSMHSIVATIQAEQDRAIRAPQKGVVQISGGPGTGKTVVALHRAAYLLYADRRRYETGGVLVVGPSGVFMRYIERVLPSLGETAVALRSLGEVVDGVRATRRDDPGVAEVKGSAAMAEVLRRTARQSVPGSPREFRTFYRDDVLVLGGRDLGPSAASCSPGQPQPVDDQGRLDARRRCCGARSAPSVPWSGARRTSPRRCAPTTRSSSSPRPGGRCWTRPPSWAGCATPRCWPGSPRVSSTTRRSGCWRSRGARTSPSTTSPLVDELRYLLGDPPIVHDAEEDPLELADSALHELHHLGRARVSQARAAWTPPTNRIEDDGYAHVLVDEAQDLTPMQWRMVGRRGRAATWTIVGDPAQSSWPVPEESERARAAARLAHRRQAGALLPPLDELPQLGGDLPLRRRVRRPRRSRRRPARRRAVDRRQPEEVVDGRPRGGHARGAQRSARLRRGHRRGRRAGRTARRGRALGGGWPEVAGLAEGDDARVAVLTGLDTKGLEFDGIVVVEPGEIEAESPSGRATLYVVYTRATQQMVTVSSRLTRPRAGPHDR